MATFPATLYCATNDPEGTRQITLTASTPEEFVPFNCDFNYETLLDGGIADFGDYPIEFAAPVGSTMFAFFTDNVQEVTITDIVVTGGFEIVELSATLPATISFGSLICLVGPTAVLGAHTGTITVTLLDGRVFTASLVGNVIP